MRAPIKQKQPKERRPKTRKRVQLGLIVTARMKALIQEEAERTGRTQSQAAEAMLERLLAIENTLRAMNRTPESLAREVTEAEMIRSGYRKQHDPQSPLGFVWLPPNTPGPHSGFEPWEEGEYVPPSVEIPAPDSLPDNRDNPTTKKMMARLDELEAWVRQAEKKD
jgi:hypothetical protein